jgi:hypothetical protein
MARDRDPTVAIIPRASHMCREEKMATTLAATGAVTKVATTQIVTLETIIGIASTALTKARLRSQ